MSRQSNIRRQSVKQTALLFSRSCNHPVVGSPSGQNDTVVSVLLMLILRHRVDNLGASYYILTKQFDGRAVAQSSR